MKNELFIEDQVKAEEPEHSNDNNQADNPEKEVVTEKAKGITTGNGEVPADMQVILIDRKLIVKEYHPRTNLGDIKGLQRDIEERGLHKPLIVNEVGNNQYVVVDGYRRFVATAEHGRPKLPCIVKKMTAAEAAHFSYDTNERRSGFTPMEKGLHLKAMQERFGYSTRDLQRMGYGSASQISNIMRLLDLPEAVQKKVQEGELTSTHAVALLKLKTSEEKENMAKEIVKDDLSVKQVEQKIEKFVAKGEKVDKPAEAQPADTDIPDVCIKQGRDMSELRNESVDLVLATLPSCIWAVEEDKPLLEECARVCVPGGIMAFQIHEKPLCKADSILNFLGPKYHSILKKHKMRLADFIIIRGPEDSPIYDPYQSHTCYSMATNYTLVYVFSQEEPRKEPAKEVVQKSALTEEERSWLSGVWTVGQPWAMAEEALHTEELCRRLIRMYSFEGDTVLDPWLRDGTTVKVARELNRKGIGYERDPQYKPIIMKKLGLESEKPSPEFFTNMTDDHLETMRANLSVPEDEREESPESHEVWVHPEQTSNQPHKVMKADTAS